MEEQVALAMIEHNDRLFLLLSAVLKRMIIG